MRIPISPAVLDLGKDKRGQTLFFPRLAGPASLGQKSRCRQQAIGEKAEEYSSVHSFKTSVPASPRRPGLRSEEAIKEERGRSFFLPFRGLQGEGFPRGWGQASP